MKLTLIIGCCCMLAAVLFSCAHPGKAEFEAVTHQSQQYYETGEYQKALDSYRVLHARFPEDTDVTESYCSMVERIKKQSDRAYARGDFAAAYRIYRLLPEYHDDLSKYQKKLSFSKSFLAERTKSVHIKLAEHTSRHHISSGHFQKAFDACEEVFRKYRKDEQSRKCLVSAASELGEKADASFKKGEYAGAAKIYAILRNNGALFKTADIFSPEDMRTLDARLANCSTNLNRKGLTLYRKGELSKALGIWKEILEFDPDNAEVRKSVEITTQQLENMQ